MRQVAVLGVAMTPFGRYPNRSLRDLGREASWAAIKDAGISPKQIEAGYLGNALGARLQGEMGIGQSVMAEIGLYGIPIINVENACASGSTAFREAWMSIAGGFHDAVIVVGVEKTYTDEGGVLDGPDSEPEMRLGLVLPGFFALMANRYMTEHNVTAEEIAQVSVKNHAHGSLNPYAQYRKPLTLEEVMSSPMVADPLTVLSCCPRADGAAAAILVSEAVARQHTTTPVFVAASVLGSGLGQNPSDIIHLEMNVKAARRAYEQAGLGPEDINVVELHDCFTIAELEHYETLGFCGRGEGVRLLADGVTKLGGKLPVNASGGLLARGHPLGATGIAQIVEMVWQLRGQAGQRQVPGARVALTHCMGGIKELDAQATTIHILRR
jgi:acetyl-CoA acetyltransferase